MKSQPPLLPPPPPPPPATPPHHINSHNRSLLLPAATRHHPPSPAAVTTHLTKQQSTAHGSIRRGVGLSLRPHDRSTGASSVTGGHGRSRPAPKPSLLLIVFCAEDRIGTSEEDWRLHRGSYWDFGRQDDARHYRHYKI